IVTGGYCEYQNWKLLYKETMMARGMPESEATAIVEAPKKETPPVTTDPPIIPMAETKAAKEYVTLGECYDAAGKLLPFVVRWSENSAEGNADMVRMVAVRDLIDGKRRWID